MRPSIPLFKLRGSSSRWLTRQSQDPYVRQRASDPDSISYRARSAFKLVSLAKKYPDLLAPGKGVVDLGAAPGGWSQVAADRVKAREVVVMAGGEAGEITEGEEVKMKVGFGLRGGGGEGVKRNERGGGKRGKVIAVDMLQMAPIKGVQVVRGDFMQDGVRSEVMRLLKGESAKIAIPTLGLSGMEGEEHVGIVDTVLSDMMAPMSGVRVRDIQASLDLVGAATDFARATLKVGKGVREEEGGEGEGGGEEGVTVGKSKGRKRYDGGCLVMKFFAHPDLDAFKRDELDGWFGKVVIDKPKESRSESSEAYFVCLGFKGPPL